MKVYLGGHCDVWVYFTFLVVLRFFMRGLGSEGVSIALFVSASDFISVFIDSDSRVSFTQFEFCICLFFVPILQFLYSFKHLWNNRVEGLSPVTREGL